MGQERFIPFAQGKTGLPNKKGLGGKVSHLQFHTLSFHYSIFTNQVVLNLSLPREQNQDNNLIRRLKK
jgi:hypothetical protein